MGNNNESGNKKINTSKIAFDTLLGDDLQSRKEYIENFGHLYLEQVDEM